MFTSLLIAGGVITGVLTVAFIIRCVAESCVTMKFPAWDDDLHAVLAREAEQAERENHRRYRQVYLR